MSVKGGPNTVTSGLVLELDAGNIKSYPTTGTTWFDKSGNTNNGTLTNGPTFNTGSLGSIVFDGVDDYVSTSLNPSSYNNTTQTVWYKWNGVNQIKVLSYLGNSSSNGFGLLLHDGGSGGLAGNRIGVLYGGSYYNALNTGSLYATLTSNAWCQLTIARDTSITTLYFNGSGVGSTSRTPNITSNYPYSYGDITVGAAGDVSTMQFYNRALLPQEVLQNYNATKTRFGL